MTLIYRNVYDFIKDEKRNVKQPPKLKGLKVTKKFLQYYHFDFLSSIFNRYKAFPLASLFYPTTLYHRFYWR